MSDTPYHLVWDYLHTEHGLTLLESDLLALVRMVRECDERELASVTAERDALLRIIQKVHDSIYGPAGGIRAAISNKLYEQIKAAIDAAKGGQSSE